MAFTSVFPRLFALTSDGGTTPDGPEETNTNFLTAAYTGSRNDFDGWPGYQLTPTRDIDVVALGRSISGSIAQSHVVSIYRVSDQVLVATATITPSSPTAANGYAYELTTVTLTSGAAYRICSAEFNGGDQWRDIGSLSSHTAAATIDYGVYKVGSLPGYPASTTGDPDQGFVPVTIFY